MERTDHNNWEGDNIGNLKGIQGFERNMDVDIWKCEMGIWERV